MPPDDAELFETTRVLHLRASLPRTDRPPEFLDDLCFTPDLVAAFIHAFTDVGGLVFDPFAGFGTTLATAQELGRSAIGFEIDAQRVSYARARLADPSSMHQQDVRAIDWSTVPKFNLSIASPPYMTKDDHDQNPLSGYQTLVACRR